MDKELLAEIEDEEDAQELLEMEKELEKEYPDYIKMDFSLETPEERTAKVEEIISKTPPERLTPKYLEKLTDYIIFAQDKQEKKEKRILTDNHMLTVNKRETSFEGLISHFENNENTGDAIYNMIANDKNIIFHHKKDITAEDRTEIPELQQLAEAIAEVEAQQKAARGKRAFLLKKQLIQMRQDQYVIRNAYKPQSINCVNTMKSFSKLDFSENITIDECGNVISDGIITFFNPDHVSALLCNYEKLRESNWANTQGDAKWVLEDLNNLIEKTFENTPLILDIVYSKILGLSNIEIQKLLAERHDTSYSAEYISFLWRNKIPKMISNAATDEWLVWHYTQEEKGYWKKCNRCGKIKLGHNRFFSKNSSSKDGFYSICKDCRNKKTSGQK